MSARASLVLSDHARARFRQRVGAGRPLVAARAAVALPRRRAAALFPDIVSARRWKGASRVRVSATAAFVVVRDVAVTCVALDTAQLATVLVWLMTRVWLPPAGPTTHPSPDSLPGASP